MSQVVVHIIDDDSGVRGHLRLLMENAEFEARQYESAENFLENMDLLRPGCILLDLTMRDMGGMELLQKLRADGHAIPVIIISGHADIPSTVRGMKLGAVDVLQKPFESAALLSAVGAATAASVQQHQQQAHDQSIRQRFAALTEREREMVKFVAAGKSSKQIAGELNISIKTVENHRAHLMAKIGAHNAADLTRLSLAAGIALSE